MKKFDLMKKILDSGALAVVRAKPERVLEIAESIVRGGIPVMEISYTNADAPQAIDLVHQHLGSSILVGAGTVNNSATAKDAIAHGAGFLYSPIFDRGVMSLANEYQIPYAPGCSTVTEAVEAMRAGATFIKYFPYGGLLGPDVIKTIKTPIPEMPLLESGGVDASNVRQWFDAGVEVVGIGSALSKGSKDTIEASARSIRKEIDAFRSTEK
ncbi:ketohydroxyglutarate aldolase [Lacticaseibacillus parahuelsenbergensis]|uniref:Ketohydroxyglutarate aldolase n=1 Tax=Lacticaseibacillus parahuelsenbergensis TaxID=3068305 RepID=A0ABY9L3W9_9LACO|nr:MULTISPECIES: ketohydroxyglutarate aldolase [Lacticaseibacillus]MDE3281525.1 ketohydroxyglutarate aldolase [Lacticaseibacillus casei]WLV78441.1 ketohydroxyglutarate aldolase [Lacticaseibacillus sp. NCIMB 15471]